MSAARIVRVGGVEKHGKSLRVAQIREDGTRDHIKFPIDRPDLAQAYVDTFRREAGQRIIGIGAAVNLYVEHLKEHGGYKKLPVKDRTARVIRTKLEGLLRLPNPVRSRRGRKARIGFLIGADRPVGDLTAALALRLYNERCREVKPDTHRGELAYAQAFGKWLVVRGYVKVNPFEEVIPSGLLSAGKETLTVDEARRFFHTAMADESLASFAAAVVLCMGMRSNELLDRTVRDLDEGGTVLRIPITSKRLKTRHSARRLMIPEMLRPRFQQLANAAGMGLLAAGQSGSEAKLFGTTHNNTLLKQVKRLCIKSGVPVVCTHGLRGSAITNAVEMGTPLAQVGMAGGHGPNSRMTGGPNYMRPGTIESVEAARAAERLGTPGSEATQVQTPVGTSEGPVFPNDPNVLN